MSLAAFFFRHQLNEDEDLLAVIHKHWFELVVPTFRFLFLGLLFPWAVWWLFLSQVPMTYWGAAIWSGFFFVWYMVRWADWYFDAWLCTDTSLIDLEWDGLFSRSSSRIAYHEIREIGTSTTGFWGTLFRYGTVTVGMDTGGELRIENVSRPKLVEEKVSEMRDRILLHQKMSQTDAIHNLLSDVINNHIEQHGFPDR